VIGVGRDPERCDVAVAELASPTFTLLRADLSSLAATVQVAGEIVTLTPHINVLINNAGGVRPVRVETAEGHEATFAANHLAPFLLTKKLMPHMATAARVIAVSSTGHEHCPAISWDDLDYRENWSSGVAYCQAKLANILFTRELARRFGGDGLIAHAMHPGVVDSNFVAHCEPGMKAYMASIMPGAFTPDQSAETLTFLATAEEPGRTNGLYWHQNAQITPSALAQDEASAKRLWEVSEALVSAY
jgi:NAD(P)-dependent dehydrogenase (short-subunit alcohol dehydrogenase family)